jgi:hypothetical protein
MLSGMTGGAQRNRVAIARFDPDANYRFSYAHALFPMVLLCRRRRRGAAERKPGARTRLRRLGLGLPDRSSDKARPTNAAAARSRSHHHVHLAAAASGADEPLAPIRNDGLGAVRARKLGGMGLDPWLHALNHTMSRTRASAALPSVIGGVAVMSLPLAVPLDRLLQRPHARITQGLGRAVEAAVLVRERRDALAGAVRPPGRAVKDGLGGGREGPRDGPQHWRGLYGPLAPLAKISCSCHCGCVAASCSH